jgi:hypothetical protein
LHSAIIQSGLKGASKFDFKYVPQDGFRVKKEGNGRKGVKYGLFSRPVEIFYLIIFLVGVIIAASTCFLALGMIVPYQVQWSYVNVIGRGVRSIQIIVSGPLNLGM